MKILRTGASFIEPLAWGVAALLGALVVGSKVSGESSTIAFGLLGALGIAGWLAWSRQPRRMLIAGVYFFAPIDVSKAIIAPDGQFDSPGLYLTAAHVALLLLTVLWLGRRVLVERRPIPFTRMDGLAVIFFGWMLARSIGTPQGGLATASAIAYGLAVLGYYVSSHALETSGEMRLALRAVVAGAAAELLWTAAQIATHSELALPGAKIIPGNSELLFGGEGEAFRPNGFFIHPNSLADHMTLLIPPAFALVMLGRRRLHGRVWWTALATLLGCSGMLLATLSRGGWAAAILGGLWVVWRFYRGGLLGARHLAQMAGAAVVGAIVLVSVYPNILLRLTAPDDRSTESRLILNDQAFTIIKAHPWIGVGFANYNRAAHEYIGPRFANISQEYQEQLLHLVVHNHYLLVAAQLGLPAMVLFAILMVCFVLLPSPWKAWRDPTAFALAAGLSAALVTQVLFLASDNFDVDARLFMIWLTAGTLQALCLQRREAERLAAPAGSMPFAASGVGPAP